MVDLVSGIQANLAGTVWRSRNQPFDTTDRHSFVRIIGIVSEPSLITADKFDEWIKVRYEPYRRMNKTGCSYHRIGLSDFFKWYIQVDNAN